jgi:16S rRNA (guanine966-N2)-methyltransferase
MRVVAGSVGGRRLVVPDGPRSTTRPTSELVRGAVFNSLTSMDAVDDAVVWDLFAGSGALGIEALSRGAREAVFVDGDGAAAAVIRANLDSLGMASTARVVCGDVPQWLETAGRADLALVDPPYRFDGWDALLGLLAADLAVCESDRPIEPPGPWEVVRVRRHGGTVVTLLRRGAARP